MYTQIVQWLASPFISTMVSVLLGGLITWLTAWVYYRKAGEDLKDEAALLRKANAAIIYYLEHPDAEIKARYDVEGNLVDLIVSAVGHAAGRSTAKGVAEDAKHDS
jgi:hypothetical protein